MSYFQTTALDYFWLIDVFVSHGTCMEKISTIRFGNNFQIQTRNIESIPNKMKKKIQHWTFPKKQFEKSSNDVESMSLAHKLHSWPLTTLAWHRHFNKSGGV